MRHALYQDVPIEAVREYWDARPCNIRHSPKPIGTKEYFEEVEARKYFVEPHIPRFAQFERWSGRTVLEIGCGIGTDTINFARHGAKVTAVDLSENSLDVARKRAEVFGLLDRIEFHLGDAEQLPRGIGRCPFDLIYSFGVLHHTPHPDRALSQLRQLAGAGTTLKVMLYHRCSWKVLAILVNEAKGRFWRLDEFIARNSETATGCPVTYAYTRSEACALLAEAGFHVSEVTVEHIFPWRVEDYVRHRYRKVWYLEAMPRCLFSALERRAGWHICLTARP